MKLNDESRTRITVEMQTSLDPTGTTVELKVDSTWFACSWEGSPVLANGVYTQKARTTGYFAGPAHAAPAGATVLTLGDHATETRVTWSGGDQIVQYAGLIEVAAT